MRLDIAVSQKEISSYQQEIHQTLNRLREAAPPLQPLDYFFQIVEQHFSLEKAGHEDRKVIALGSNVPEELLLASGAAYYWVLGGSPRTGAWISDIVPRDADAVSRSMLGFLNNDIEAFSKDALILIPAVSDNNRKLAYMLRQAGYKVHTIDFPPVKDQWAEEKWIRQWESCREILSSHTRRPISSHALWRAAGSVSHCREQVRHFLKVTDEMGEMMPGTLRMFILFSYFCTSNIEEWRLRLSALTKKCRQKSLSKGSENSVNPVKQGNVLLMGSPVYFPNYKVPFLIEDAGLHISSHVDGTTLELSRAPFIKGGGRTPAARLASRFYQNDCSGAYAQNDSLVGKVSHLIENSSVDGVVYQVLKGQIEPDFELERFERLFEAYDLPVFRLETDYNGQDVEQLSIRLEAFMELITQRRCRKGAKAI